MPSLPLTVILILNNDGVIQDRSFYKAVFKLFLITYSIFPKSLRLTKDLGSLTDIFSYLNLILKHHDISRNFSNRALNTPMYLKYPGMSHLRLLPRYSLLVDLGAAWASRSCPSWSFLSYAVGTLPSALPLRQKFANVSLLYCMVALTSELLEWSLILIWKKMDLPPEEGSLFRALHGESKSEG